MGDQQGRSRQREWLMYWIALTIAAAHIGWGWLQGPQPKGERPPPTAMVALANDIGFWAMIWLVAALACTPLRLWTGATWPARWRRTLGLTAAALSGAHVLVWSMGEMRLDIVKITGEFRKEIWLWPGLAALVGMVVLAATSPGVVVKRLGGARWRQVHRVVYGVGVLAVLHYALRPWADPQHWIGFGVATAVFLAARRA